MGGAIYLAEQFSTMGMPANFLQLTTNFVDVTASGNKAAWG